ncbi:hypothetical protein N9795_01400 [Candidatus Pelagibacter sp.]|nr:hypothetical protein [Candidatus Pelagibacter sp.]
MEKKVVLHQVKHSPSSIFTKEDVIKLIEQIEVETTLITISELNLDKLFMEEKTEEKLPYMMSLYDYLGRAAGKELGGEVFRTAMALRETVEERPISNPKYTGNVHLYRREFLDEYFNKKIYEGEKKQ